MISSTTDGGINWTSPISIGIYSLYDIYFVTDSIGYIVGGSNIYDNPPNPYKGIIYKTINKGSSWQVMDSSYYNGLNKLSFPNDSIGYAVGMNGNILKIINANNIHSSIQNIFLSNNELLIYPNPFSDNLTITTTTTSLSEIILYDIASRKLLQQKFTGSVTLNTEQLAKGIYIYEVRSKENTKKGKVVKE